MTSSWNNFNFAIPALRREFNSGRYHGHSGAPHYAGEYKTVVCRCHLMKHEGKRLVKNLDIKNWSAAFFRSNPDEFICTQAQWRAYSGDRTLRPIPPHYGRSHGRTDRTSNGFARPDQQSYMRNHRTQDRAFSEFPQQEEEEVPQYIHTYRPPGQAFCRSSRPDPPQRTQTYEPPDRAFTDRQPEEFVDSAAMRRRPANHIVEDDEVISVCLKEVLEVFPDISVDYVLTLIKETVMLEPESSITGGYIISQVLEAWSYPKEKKISSIDSHMNRPATNAETFQARRNVTPPLPGRTVHPKHSIAENKTEMQGQIGVPPLQDFIRPPRSITNRLTSQCLQGSTNEPERNTESIPSAQYQTVDETCGAELQISTTAFDSCHKDDTHDTGTPVAPPSTMSFNLPCLNELVTDPTHNGWNDSPERTAPHHSPTNIPSSEVPPPLLRYSSSYLNELVTDPMHNGWNYSPEWTPSPRPKPSQSGSLHPETVSSLEQLRISQHSPTFQPRMKTPLDSNGPDSDAAPFIQGDTLANPFVSGGSEAALGLGTTMSGSSLPRRRRTDSQTNSAPATPGPSHPHSFRDAEDSTPSGTHPARRPSRKPLSPANIDGKWEYIDAEEIKNSGVVAAAADSAGNFQTRSQISGSFSRNASSERGSQDPTTPERSDRHRRVRFESPGACDESSPTIGTPPQPEEDDMPPAFANYQGTPERQKRKRSNSGR